MIFKSLLINDPPANIHIFSFNDKYVELAIVYSKQKNLFKNLYELLSNAIDSLTINQNYKISTCQKTFALLVQLKKLNVCSTSENKFEYFEH